MVSEMKTRKDREEKIKFIIRKVREIRKIYLLKIVDIEEKSGVSQGIISRMLCRGYIPVRKGIQEKIIKWFNKNVSKYPLPEERTKSDTRVIAK